MRGIGRLNYAQLVHDPHNQQFLSGDRIPSDDTYISPQPEPRGHDMNWGSEPYSGHGMSESASDSCNQDEIDSEDGILKESVVIEEDNSDVEESYSIQEKIDNVFHAVVLSADSAAAKIDSSSTSAALEPVHHLKLD